MMRGLSVCCQVWDPPRRVAAAFAPLRDIAEQIVIGVDPRLAGDDLEPLRELADVVVDLAQAARPDRLRPQLFAACTQPWILSIDSDEVPSSELLDVLPCLLEADDVVQYRIARRWCFPDPAHWLEEIPWWPDFQTRLVRRDVAAIAGAGPHDGLLAEEPARYVLEPLYHLDTVLSSYETRAAKATRYEQQSPGRPTFGGGPFNRTFYLPEHYATQRFADTPPDDLESLTRVIAADDRLRGAFQVAGASVTPAPQTALPRAAYAAKLVVVERDRRLAPGERRPIVVDIHNLGSAPFADGTHPAPPIFATYHLRALDGTLLVADGVRTHFPCAIVPGAHELVPVVVEAPETPGRYLIEFDLVHEDVRWFDCTVAVDIVVAERWAQFAVDQD